MINTLKYVVFFIPLSLYAMESSFENREMLRKILLVKQAKACAAINAQMNMSQLTTNVWGGHYTIPKTFDIVETTPEVHTACNELLKKFAESLQDNSHKKE